MESLYFNANLIGLLREIRLYLNQEETVELIANLDKIKYLDTAINKNFSLQLYLEYIRSSYLLVFKGFVRKLKRDYLKYRVSIAILKEKIYNYLDNYQILVELKSKNYLVASIEDLIDIFNEEFKKIDVFIENEDYKGRR